MSAVPVPYTRLLIGQRFSIAVSGKHIHVINSTTGDVLASTTHSSGHDRIVTVKSRNGIAGTGNIVVVAVNRECAYLVSVAEDKMLRLWKLPELELVNERELPKRPTALAFTKDSQTIIVSDKFGDVFSYPFSYTPSTEKPDAKSTPDRSDLASHDNPSNGSLILGHVSPITSFFLTPDEKYIITADRDEHIRVSWFPQGYVIERYCLGHRKYVSAVHMPFFENSGKGSRGGESEGDYEKWLVSGGGDPELRVWDWMEGKCVGEVKIWDAVEKFFAVKSVKGRRNAEDDEDGEGGEQAKRKGKGKKSKRRGKKTGVQNQENVEEQQLKDERDYEGVEDEKRQEVEEKVLVINKIQSLQHGKLKYIVFGAVGATALFGFEFPSGGIHHFDLGYPVVDFAIDDEKKIWISLDTSWPYDKPSGIAQLVKVLQVDEQGNFTEASLTPESEALLRSLNERCIEQLTDPKDGPDFYVDLKAMPKWSEPSTAVSEKAGSVNGSRSIAGNGVTNDSGKALTKREEARMKNKKNVLAKMREIVASDAGEGVSGEKVGTVRQHDDDADDDREVKRIKTDDGKVGDGGWDEMDQS